MALTALEAKCLAEFRNDLPFDKTVPTDSEGWLRIGLRCLFEAGNLIRSKRNSPSRLATNIKADGSPVSSLDKLIEKQVRVYFGDHFPEVDFVGEETGGELFPRGISIALDPLDGTWSFLTHHESCATSLAFFRDGSPFLGMIMNPATGELGYALYGGISRLIQLSMFNEADQATELPTSKEPADNKYLINLHPSRPAGELVRKLYSAWGEDRVNIVRATGGSPAWSLLDAAKGYHCYINLWSGAAAKSYDLAAGILLVRGAGGEVVDINGAPIPLLGHQGPFLAGIYNENFAELRRLLKSP